MLSEAFSVVREENPGGGVEVVAGVAESVLGGVFSGRIGLAMRGAFYSGDLSFSSAVDRSTLRTMRWSIGSTWHRWDPHIHAPGTLKENQYGPHDDNAVWERYFAKIREAQPACSALGITDYFVPRGYRLFLERGGRTQLPELFVFPNVELRLKTRAERGNAPNVHLLISPEPHDHLSVITSKLAALTFTFGGEEFRCTEDDLRRLGRAIQRDPSLNDEAALRAGAAQFLVDHDHFAKLKHDPWIHQHVLFAVAAGNDGLGGLKADGAFKAHREELGRIADVIFSGSPSERRYWLGDHPDVEQRISGVKPCLHGSDAHAFDRILAPDEDRLLSSELDDGIAVQLADGHQHSDGHRAYERWPSDARRRTSVSAMDILEVARGEAGDRWPPWHDRGVVRRRCSVAACLSLDDASDGVTFDQFALAAGAIS